MRATALDVTETTALVELRPCWLAKLFGARTTRVALNLVGKPWTETLGAGIQMVDVWRNDETGLELRHHWLTDVWTITDSVAPLPRATVVP